MVEKIRIKPNHGFTIVELLIVIVVIGILAALVLNSFSDAQKQARDSRRLSDMTAIKKALLAYRADKGAFPEETATISPAIEGGWETSKDTPGSFMEYLVAGGYFRDVPLDPLNTNANYYRYYLYPAGDYGCDASRGKYAVLGVVGMETSNGVHPENPGFQCAGRNWNPEFEWVIGFFENE